MAEWERPSLSSGGGRASKSRPTKPHRLRWVLIVVALAAIGSFGWMSWRAYKSGGNGIDGIVPLIKADTDPTRIRPDDPGGMPVPNQDKTIYDKLDPRSAPPKGVERLLPPPETPADRPPDEVASSSSASKPAIPTLGESGEAPARNVGTATVKAPVEPPAPAAPKAASVPSPFVRAEPPPAPAKTRPAKPPTQTATATPTPAQTASKPAAISGIRLQLGAVGSEEAAQKEWDRIRRANTDILGSLTPNFVRADLGAKGVVYRIQAGPVATAQAGADLCTKLKARNVGCFVAR